MHVESDPYLKLGVFCPFWMVNKTNLTLCYKVCVWVFRWGVHGIPFEFATFISVQEGDKITMHPPGDDIILLSTGNKKNKVSYTGTS